MPVNYQAVTPSMLYAGLRQTDKNTEHKLSNFVAENNPVGNSYLELLAQLIIAHGKRPAPEYARMFGSDPRHFDGALRCLTGMSAHDWINEYLRLVACDLLEHSSLNFKQIGKMLNLSQSSFTQFFRNHQQAQPWEYRSEKLNRRKKYYYLRQNRY